MFNFFNKNKDKASESLPVEIDGLVVTVFDRWKEIAETSPQDLPLEEDFSSKNEQYIWRLLNIRFMHLMMVVKEFVTEKFDEKITPIINMHKDELNSQYQSKVTKDRYGVLSDNGWLDERHYFITSVLRTDTDNLVSEIWQAVTTFDKMFADDESLKRLIKRDFSEKEFPVSFLETNLKKECDTLFVDWIKADPGAAVEVFIGNKVLELCFQRIHQIIDDPELKQQPSDVAENKNDNDKKIDGDISNISPYDYEEMCAQILRENGWDARTTKKSGDQGTDVYAEKNGISLVLQCKMVNSPVGTKAVQETIAGQKYMSADYAAVVSPSTYTPGAKDLAKVAKVMLLSHEDVAHIDALMKVLS